MSLTRILEPEVMDSDEEARDYDAMNHTSVNAAFCEDLLALTSDLDPTLDVGTGTALISIELCPRARGARVVAIDLAQSMLRRAEANVVVRPGGVLFIRDLIRPETDDAVQAFCEQYGADDTPQQLALFDASLRASLTLDEARQLAKACGIPASAVQQTSDRHWTLGHHVGSERA